MTTDMGPPPPKQPPTTSTQPESTPESDVAPQPETEIQMPPLPPKNPSTTESNSEASETDSKQKQQNVAVPYEIPPWSAKPLHEYYLEVLKDGSIIDQFYVYDKGAYMFGRVDLCDFVLEHPTVSRFHAVIQFKEDGNAYVYDLGSTHGTFINKNQVKKKVYVDLHVGDVIRFGQSSRLYIFQGPPELMPAETDLDLIRESKIRREMQDREASLQRARRQASLNDGVTWGMGEDAIEEYEDDSDEVTWQTFKGLLTEKQEKTREKLIKRIEKVGHMKKEIDAIRAKDIAQGGLTQGQQTQIARNEQRITQLMEEIENLEETLNESIRESIGARAGKISRRKKGAAEEEEDFSSDDDDFYDRTKKKVPIQKGGDKQTVETADSLLDKRDTIMKEMEEKEQALLTEKKKLAAESAEATEAGDALDSYMSGLSSQLVINRTAQLEEEMAALKSELDRISYLLKIADPTGEAAKKRGLKLQEPNTEKPLVPPAMAKKQPLVVPKMTMVKERETVSGEKEDNQDAAADLSKHVEAEKRVSKSTEDKVVASKNAETEKKVGRSTGDKVVASKNVEAEEKVGKSTEDKVVAYSVVKPKWLGAVDATEIKETQQPELFNVGDSEQFIDYKDRQKIIQNAEAVTSLDSELESAAPGLIIRKRKAVEKHELNDEKTAKQSESSAGSGFIAEDAVALLLKHTRGFHAEEDGADNSQERSGNEEPSNDNKKPKRVMGPEKPKFLDSNPDYDSWVPPEGQSGDGRTSLNDRYGY